ncbi:MAG: VanZ family protein [Lachnospiraceae bacterium]|nr:VanZ family protein [Lachnospiraceae bacterium]
MVLLVYFLFFSEEYGRTEPYTTYQYNLEPFRELRRYLAYRNQIGNGLFLINVVGNVVAFMPFGFLVPVMYREQRRERSYQGHYFRSFLFVTFLGFLSSLGVETLQLVTKVGSFDVDDLILNTVGVILGYFIYYICKKMIGVFGKR